MEMCIRQVRTDRKLIALTFDDGPNAVYTSELLDIFRPYGAKATFFVIGEALELHPDMAKAAFAEGHELGNHTYSHPNLTETDDDEARSQLDKTDLLLSNLTGEKPRLFRPPYLAYNETTVELCEQYDYMMIGGVNHDTRDWAEPGVDHIVKSVRSHIGNGNIIVLHDSGGDRSQTVEAIRRLLPEIAAGGYAPVTVSELLRSARG